MRHLQSATLPARQQGVTLIISLIFLAILMLLGVTAAQTSMMEERMAGNTRDRNLAFQSADAVLKVADTALNALPKDAKGKITAPFDGTVVGYPVYNAADANDVAYWNAYNWAGASILAGTALVNVDSQPRYIIQLISETATIQRFRITARGVGSSDGTVVIVQAGYENTHNP